MAKDYDIVIIGGGPAGLSAGLYSTRDRLSTILVEKGPIGGQIINAALVENYPGFPEGISGYDLTELMYQQAKKYGLEVASVAVAGIEVRLFDAISGAASAGRAKVDKNLAKGVELGKGSVALMLGLTLVLGIGLFFLLPLLIASVTTARIEQGLVQHLVEGLVRVAIFLGYLALISRTPDIARVFQYHGAEHMTIHALESGNALTVAEVRRYPTAHPRCGTEFLVVLIALSIIAFSLVGRQEPLVMVGSRILLIPVLAALGYEVLRWGARNRANPVVKVIMWPGILVQMITTKQPTDDQIEVAIVSMQEALKADGEAIPEGSDMPERAPLDPVHPAVATA